MRAEDVKITYRSNVFADAVVRTLNDGGCQQAAGRDARRRLVAFLHSGHCRHHEHQDKREDEATIRFFSNSGCIQAHTVAVTGKTIATRTCGQHVQTRMFWRFVPVSHGLP